MADARTEAFDRLEALDAAISEAIEDLLQARTRIKTLLDQRDSGTSWSQIVLNQERPLVVELVTHSLGALSDAGGKFRRAQAEALRQEGMPMARIATLFGVSRQRISSLLSSRH